jgi:hypothetical protein
VILQPPLGSGAARRGDSSPSSCTEPEGLGNSDGRAASLGTRWSSVDDSVDTSSRGKAIADLTDALRKLLAEGDGEGAPVVIRALDELACLVAPIEPAREARVAELQVVRRRPREGAWVGDGSFEEPFDAFREHASMQP